YTQFSTSPYVRTLIQGGSSMRITPTGVRSWSYENRGYKVVLLYRVDTPLMSRNVQITAIGKESPTKEYGGRQWHIAQTETGALERTPELTDEGNAFMGLVASAHAFAQAWLSKVNAGDVEPAYLDTLSVQERARQRQQGAAHVRAELSL